MRKIDVRDYSIKARLPSGELINTPYIVKEMLVGVLLHPSLGITGAELYKRLPIADKIKNADDGFALLEEGEYSKLLSAVNSIQGFGMNDAEMVRRIIEAKEIAVKEIDTAKK
jgi:hypothetical protein